MFSLSGCVYTTSFADIRESLETESSGSNWGRSAPKEVAPAPPPSGPLEGQVLAIALDGLVDEDGLGGLTYRWEMETESDLWVPLDGEVSSSMIPTQTHVGYRLRVVVRYLDGGGTEERMVSPPTEPVQNVNNSPLNVPMLNGVARQHESLFFDASKLADPDGLGPLQFSWQVSEDQVVWETLPGEAQYLLRLTQPLVGKVVRGVITYVDAYGFEEMVTVGPSSRVQEVDDPVEGNPRLIGDALKGQVLTLDVSDIRDLDGIADLAVSWEASPDGMQWRELGARSAFQVTLNQSLVNHVLRARVQVTDRLGNVTELLSPVSAQVQNVNSAPRGTIRIMQ